MDPYGGRTTRRLRLKRAFARLAGLAWRPSSSGLRCLTYHFVTAADEHDPAQMTTPVDLLRAQLDHLRSTGRPIVRLGPALNDLRDGVLPAGSVALTFDDGSLDALTRVLPVLEEHSAPATFFVTTGFVRRDPAAMRSAWPGTYLSVDELRRLAASPLVEIGAHGRTHARLRGVGADVLDAETAGARRELAEITEREVSLFAYPFGSFDSFDSASLRAVRSSGYRGAFTGIAGVNHRDSDPFRLARSRVSWAETVPEFARLLTGAYDWYVAVQRIQALRRGPI